MHQFQWNPNFCHDSGWHCWLPGGHCTLMPKETLLWDCSKYIPWLTNLSGISGCFQVLLVRARCDHIPMPIRDSHIILWILHPEMFTDKISIHDNSLSEFPPGIQYLLRIKQQLIMNILVWVLLPLLWQIYSRLRTCGAKIHKSTWRNFLWRSMSIATPFPKL